MQSWYCPLFRAIHPNAVILVVAVAFGEIENINVRLSRFFIININDGNTSGRVLTDLIRAVEHQRLSLIGGDQLAAVLREGQLIGLKADINRTPVDQFAGFIVEKLNFAFARNSIKNGGRDQAWELTRTSETSPSR